LPDDARRGEHDRCRGPRGPRPARLARDPDRTPPPTSDHGVAGGGSSVNLGELAYPDVPQGAMHLLPLGATEPHGPHAPLSTDTLISVGICERAAERLTGEIPVLVLPALAYGVIAYVSDLQLIVSYYTVVF